MKLGKGARTPSSACRQFQQRLVLRGVTPRDTRTRASALLHGLALLAKVLVVLGGMSQLPGSTTERDGTTMSPAPLTLNEIQSHADSRWFQRSLNSLFAVQCLLVWTGLWLAHRPFGSTRWPEGLQLLLAAASTLMALAEELPWQNVLLASVIITFVSGLIQGLAILAGASFGNMMNSAATWSRVLIWLVAILNARGVARLAIARWRTSPFYGCWLIGVTVLLVGFFGFGLRNLEFAGAELHPYRRAEQAVVRPEAAPALSLLWWAVAALPALALATPSLINKRPVALPQPRQPLFCWLLLNSLFAGAACLHRRWLEAALIAAGNLTLVFLAFPGCRVHDCSSRQTV